MIKLKRFSVNLIYVENNFCKLFKFDGSICSQEYECRLLNLYLTRLVDFRIKSLNSFYDLDAVNVWHVQV